LVVEKVLNNPVSPFLKVFEVEYLKDSSKKSSRDLRVNNSIPLSVLVAELDICKKEDNLVWIHLPLANLDITVLRT